VEKKPETLLIQGEKRVKSLGGVARNHQKNECVERRRGEVGAGGPALFFKASNTENQAKGNKNEKRGRGQTQSPQKPWGFTVKKGGRRGVGSRFPITEKWRLSPMWLENSTSTEKKREGQSVVRAPRLVLLCKA